MDLSRPQVQFTGEAAGGGEGEGMVRQLQDASRPGVDAALRCDFRYHPRLVPISERHESSTET